MVHPFYLSVFRAVRSVTVVRSIGHWCEHCFRINTITLGLGVPSAAPASLVDHKTCTRNSYPKLLCQRAAALVGILNAEEWLAVRAGIAREKCTASPSYIIKHAMASHGSCSPRTGSSACSPGIGKIEAAESNWRGSRFRMPTAACTTERPQELARAAESQKLAPDGHPSCALAARDRHIWYKVSDRDDSPTSTGLAQPQASP